MSQSCALMAYVRSIIIVVCNSIRSLEMFFPHSKLPDVPTKQTQTNQELEYWKQLVFAFDMDNRQSQNSSRAQRRGSNPRPDMMAGSGNINQPQTQVIIPLFVSCYV